MTTVCHAASRFAFNSPDEAIAAMTEAIVAVGCEQVPLLDAAGRILARPVHADRPSPPCDVSAMDGYAVRLADVERGTAPVAGEILIGREPPRLPPGAALRIVTGAAVPVETEAVIRREDVEEEPDAIRISPEKARALKAGANIRRRGENAPAGAEVLPSGGILTPAAAGALAAFGEAAPLVHRRVRIAILTTGDEVLPPTSSPLAWQVRDSNGPALAALMAGAPWLSLTIFRHVPDDAEQLRTAVAEALEECDALLLTGGVSMGTRDYVPHILRDLDARTIFHKLPQRPGKPLLGAIGPAGQPIFGLPGNPLSVMVTARRIALPVLLRLAGHTAAVSPLTPHPVAISRTEGLGGGFWWHRPARLVQPGRAEILELRGSGDVVGAARSDGFVELAPAAHGESGCGDDAHREEALFYSWSCA